MAKDLPPVLSAPEVAELTGYDVATICRWCRSGSLGEHVIRKLPGLRGTWVLRPTVLEVIRHK